MFLLPLESLIESSLMLNSNKMLRRKNFSIFSNVKALKKYCTNVNVNLVKTDESNNTQKTATSSNNNITDSLVKWAIQNNITNNALTKLLKVLTECGIKNLPTSSKSLLLEKENKISVIKMPPGYYTHFGFKKNLESLISALVEKDVFTGTDISVSVFIDELPLAKMKGQSLWVILGSVDGFTDNIFFIGTYWGFSRPNCPNFFLSEFVKEAKDLTTKGLEINNVMYNVQVKRLICDAPAKAFVLNIKNFTGYSSCIKCETTGEFINNKVSFLKKSTPRKNEDFEKSEMYLNVKSCLLEIPNFGVVSSVAIDYMHLVCLGVVKKLLSLWLSSDEYWTNFNAVNEMFQGLSSVYPCELQKRPKQFKLNNLWTASEFRQFLLYYGPIILKNNLKGRYYNHFLDLHIACRLLCTEASVENIHHGRELLNIFVKNYKPLYKTEEITHNIHGLYHLADDCVNHGILDNFSSFPFEKFLLKLKNRMKKNLKKLVPQTILRESYDKIFQNSLARLPSDTFKVSQKIEVSENNEFKNFSHYEKMFLCNHIIMPNSSGDKYVLLKNGKIIEVTDILKTVEKSKKYFIAGKEFHSVSNFYSEAFQSLKLDTFLVQDPSDDVGLWSVDLIEKKGMKIPIGNKKSVFIGLLDKNF